MCIHFLPGPLPFEGFPFLGAPFSPPTGFGDLPFLGTSTTTPRTTTRGAETYASCEHGLDFSEEFLDGMVIMRPQKALEAFETAAMRFDRAPRRIGLSAAGKLVEDDDVVDDVEGCRQLYLTTSSGDTPLPSEDGTSES